MDAQPSTESGSEAVASDHAHAPGTPLPPEPGRVRRWMIDHDDRWSFILVYVGLAVGLSLTIGVFWLFVVVAGHLALEVVEKRHFGCRGPVRTLAWSLWDMKLDLGLCLAAVVLLMYTTMTFGVLGVGSASRATLLGIRVSRLAALSRLSPVPIRDAALSARFALVRKVDRREQAQKLGEDRDRARAERLCSEQFPWHESWSWMDRISLGFIALNIAALLASPLLVEESAGEILDTLRDQLHPFPGA